MQSGINEGITTMQRKLIMACVAAACAASGAAYADVSVSGYVKNETAFMTSNKQYIGEATSTTDTASHHNEFYKFQNQARIFANADLTKETKAHLEINAIYDSEADPNSYQGHKSYTQNDWLREAYIDTKLGPVDLRLGKQQVVWGTADGIKLLDIINPTDFREYSQNTMDESRIPVWMAKADMSIGKDSSLQFIASQAKENKIPGLNASGDQGQPFLAKGVDTITGKVNGFLNVTPGLANVARNFSNAAAGGFFDVTDDGAGDALPTGLNPFTTFSVAGFSGGPMQTTAGGIICGVLAGCVNAAFVATPDGGGLLNNITQNGANLGLGFSNNQVLNLADVAYDSGNPNAAFEYMPNATFATFNTFAGLGAKPNATSEYIRDYPSDSKGNFGLRFKQSTSGGFNYSLNYLYHYDANPVVRISWHDATTGERLTTEHWQDTNANGALDTQLTSTDAVPNAFVGATAPTVMLRNAAGQYYGAFNTGLGAGLSANGVKMRFTESLNRVHSLGGAFDTSVETGALGPVVLRGEFVYDKDTMQPVIDRRLLGIGDLENALTPQKQDMFKYVLGADITVLTNMLVSGQFIQFRNLDYKDEKRSCTTQRGATFDCSKYTADAPTLHLTNGLKKAEENKEFVSLFFSKPFGGSQQHRWNNITIFEDEGGYWNRFDLEYSFTDKLIGSAEWNHYWGDQNSWFGQMENSSNIGVGIKYLFD